MCGIAGWIGSEPLDDGAFARALETLKLRGPDGSGIWKSRDGRALLGHRRLAILDTSARGEEPSIAPDRQSAFLHNGEIYNFRALRSDLQRRGEQFLSESDGEVAHRLLRRDGREALTKLEGMFALALWDDRERRLLLAR